MFQQRALGVIGGSLCPGAAEAPSRLLAMRGIAKSFGTTQALRDVDLSVDRGTVVGLLGGNGAGKSTLMKVLGGLVEADRGAIDFLGDTLGRGHSPAVAMRLGIRFVHQEFSLCSNLRVYENFVVDLPDVIAGMRWRMRGRHYARAALEEVFPGSRIDPRATVSSLSLSDRQKVEIALATSHPQTRLVILDEPTSSLGSRDVEQLQAHVRRRKHDGVSFIFISHRLHETLDIVDNVVVLRNGAVAWAGPAGGTSQAELMRLLGGPERFPATPLTANEPRAPVLTMTNVHTFGIRGVSLDVARGEIVGLAGLEGSGQREVLRAVFSRRAPESGAIAIDGAVAFVSGDRATEGIFPLWSINDNIVASTLVRLSRWGIMSLHRSRALAAEWFARLQVRAPNGDAPVVSLSGGNQQKVVIARALAANADIILLDDPTRGVDLGTKADLYKLFRKLSDEGRAVLWYSTDDTEFIECDRTIVMRDGAVTAEFARSDFSADRLVEASFRTVEEAAETRVERRIDRTRKLGAIVPTLIPLVTFAAVFALCVTQNPVILSNFGLTLVFSAAFVLSFATISQLFTIAAGDIDLGLGPFIGLINAVAATWLMTDPWLAAGCFLLLLIAYPLMGLFVHARGVPAIIVTLGMSFVWLGLATLRLPRAGGAAPDWLVDLIKVKPPLLPMQIYLCLFPAVVAYLVLMVWRYGVVLRGFGSNPTAIAAAGWSTRTAKATIYAFSGLFAFLAGIVVTANTRGGDPTGATSMTLLSVAAVILGGAAFSGGIVAPIGALFGVLTLVLIGTLLSLLEVGGEYLPMVQGLLLLGVVGIRTILLRRQS